MRPFRHIRVFRNGFTCVILQDSLFDSDSVRLAFEEEIPLLVEQGDLIDVLVLDYRKVRCLTSSALGKLVELEAKRGSLLIFSPTWDK